MIGWAVDTVTGPERVETDNQWFLIKTSFAHDCVGDVSQSGGSERRQPLMWKVSRECPQTEMKLRPVGNAVRNVMSHHSTAGVINQARCSGLFFPPDQLGMHGAWDAILVSLSKHSQFRCVWYDDRKGVRNTTVLAKQTIK